MDTNRKSSNMPQSNSNEDNELDELFNLFTPKEWETVPMPAPGSSKYLAVSRIIANFGDYSTGDFAKNPKAERQLKALLMDMHGYMKSGEYKNQFGPISQKVDEIDALMKKLDEKCSQAPAQPTNNPSSSGTSAGSGSRSGGSQH